MREEEINSKDIIYDRSVVAKLLDIANELSASTKKVSTSTQQVNNAMEITSSSIQKINSDAGVLSDQTNVVLEEVKKAETAAEKGKQSASEVSQKMNSIKETAEEGSTKILALGEKSKVISNIVDTINNISEQTNLLALNAAIEAARAGEAGRGFAVVANEVRKLAEESKQATQKISSLIEAIQIEIDGAVESIQKTTKQVDEGSKGIFEAVMALELLPNMITAINKAANETSETAMKNSASSSEVSSAVQEINASMQDVSTFISQMDGTSNDLKSLVDQFIKDRS